MIRQFRNPNFYLIVFIDALMFALALAGAYMIRFDFTPSQATLMQMLGLMPFVIILKLAVFYFMGLYRGMWRYTSISDMFNLTRATFLNTLIIVLVIFVLYRFQGFSRGVILLDAILTISLAGGVRVLLRVLHTRGFLDGKISDQGLPQRTKKKIIVVGAGDAAEMTYREIHDNPGIHYEITGFVDDDPGKQGKSIHGRPVLGRVEDLPLLTGKYRVQELIIAIPSASGSQMRKVIEICEKTGLSYKTLPGLGEIIDGRVSIKALRDVNYADLLGRQPVELDIQGISGYLHQKTVLITGAGGSIGSELCRQIARFNPARMILFDSSEPCLYSIQMELEHQVRYLDYVPVLGALQKKVLTRRIFERYKPQVVFHAAAYKHVPLIENNPWQAVWNNVRAAETVMSLSAEYAVERFILVSTDKAVRPTNVMGASKRCCERLMYAHTGGETRFMAVRFGNVVGSAGSVAPLFRKQIELGGPITVTHPEMIRYFMTIPEASQLILETGAMGRGGEIFILDMGVPVKIADMARDLIRLSGKKPDTDIQIVYCKTRPGEKLYEELITQGEGIVQSSHDKIMVLRPDNCYDGFGDREGYRRWMQDGLEELYRVADSQDACAIKAGFRHIVPEYEIQDVKCVLS